MDGRMTGEHFWPQKHKHARCGRDGDVEEWNGNDLDRCLSPDL